MKYNKFKILEAMLRNKNGFDVSAENLPKFQAVIDILHSDLEIFAGGQKSDYVIEYEADMNDADGNAKEWSNFHLPSGRERWFQLYTIHSQQKSSRSSISLTYVLVVATFVMAFAAVVQAYCTYETLNATRDQRVVIIK